MRAPKFSLRTAWDLEPNAVSAAVERARAAGEVLDLTESNPTRVGLGAPAELATALGDPRGAAYEPLPFGRPDARAAVAAYYADRGLAVDPARVALSASTSESYGWLFKLLCDAGDRALVPTPSYPLLSFLADLEGVELATYPLVEDRGFAVDIPALEAAIDERTRVVVLVHPNNPTGSFVRRADAAAIVEICRDRGLALVVDEVFGDYAHGALDEAAVTSFVGEARALTFTLSGLSKVLAMPQAKLGWIVTSGPGGIVREAMGRLEVIADTYLSVSAGVQLALPALFAARGAVQGAIRARVAENLAALDAALVGSRARRLPVEGAWQAVLEPPPGRDDEAWTAALLEAGVLVQPGYFFDFTEPRLVVSLLPAPATFSRAAALLAATFARQ